MTILVRLPKARAVALRWVAEFVFCEALEIDVEILADDVESILIQHEQGQVAIKSCFPPTDGLDPIAAAMPEPPLRTWPADLLPEFEIRDLPVIFGRPGLQISRDRSYIECEADILGSIFFTLSRYEELALSFHDEHDRFMASASIAFRQSFIKRPVVDEWIELLWAIMTRVWPNMKRSLRPGHSRVSCDVDIPFDPIGTSTTRLALSVGSDLLRQRNLKRAASRTINFVTHRYGNLRFDPYFNFDWYMDACERAGHRAAFYFMCDRSGGAFSSDYNIDEPRVVALLRRIADRGHEIGMHGTYGTFRNPDQLLRERNALERSLRVAMIPSPPDGNRQHYLRWDAGCTPDYLQAAGFNYDATGGFASCIGFRFGTSREFRMWSWKEHGPLRIRQRPLVVMDVTVMSPSYMDLGAGDEALEEIMRIKKRSMEYGGNFNLLWHNSSLLESDERRLFLAAID